MGYASEHHDHRCKQAGLCGGFLYGWLNAVKYGAEDVKVMSEHADTICKILEMQSDDVLAMEWHAVLQAIIVEWKRINKLED